VKNAFRPIYFSTENWNRSKEEVDYLMKLTMTVVTKDAASSLKKIFGLLYSVLKIVYHQNYLRRFAKLKMIQKIIMAVRSPYVLITVENARLLMQCNELSQQVSKPELIDEKVIEDNLYHPDVPAVDLVVRTSGSSD
jgi:undecaprenyl diphosphate synthase